ncbi:MAG: hypothetical protein ACTSYI_14460 [Promethearchaeota archaeon]
MEENFSLDGESHMDVEDRIDGKDTKNNIKNQPSIPAGNPI